MVAVKGFLLLPPSLLALLTQVAANPQPTALKKLSPDSNEKIFPEHLAFAPPGSFPIDIYGTQLLPGVNDGNGESERTNSSARFFQRAFAPHIDETRESMMRRAAEMLAILEKRSSCPSDMNSCEDIGAANKCCQKGTYCTSVADSNVASVACCPDGVQCGGGVGSCPTSAVSCPSSLGGGCCLQGYICQGIGCVTEVVSTVPTTTQVQTTSSQPTVTTVTSTQTTTSLSSVPSTTQPTTSATRTVSSSATATGEAPWRPTVTDTTTSAPDTQTGCPTGFYGCLATHGGGCCQTDRECETHSCPAPSSTTLVSNGVTVVVAASNVPAAATGTCAGGWFLCGEEGGSVAGCCPSGYQCGTASCFTVEASQTGSVQKELPESGAFSHSRSSRRSLLCLVGLSVLSLLL
ncbi:unnamed protein product [Clonostachys rhizophaga]|uniref:GPI anchored protein n=1 Tax=Clonostachys rhizophaga TaxID=160324 RepID=A0A9N9YMX4_9HYPO|nr:unnamed protein product [Clonostachys rhizophaga]